MSLSQPDLCWCKGLLFWSDFASVFYTVTFDVETHQWVSDIAQQTHLDSLNIDAVFCSTLPHESAQDSTYESSAYFTQDIPRTITLPAFVNHDDHTTKKNHKQQKNWIKENKIPDTLAFLPIYNKFNISCNSYWDLISENPGYEMNADILKIQDKLTQKKYYALPCDIRNAGKLQLSWMHIVFKHDILFDFLNAYTEVIDLFKTEGYLVSQKCFLSISSSTAVKPVILNSFPFPNPESKLFEVYKKDYDTFKTTIAKHKHNSYVLFPKEFIKFTILKCVRFTRAIVETIRYVINRLSIAEVFHSIELWQTKETGFISDWREISKYLIKKHLTVMDEAMRRVCVYWVTKTCSTLLFEEMQNTNKYRDTIDQDAIEAIQTCVANNNKYNLLFEKHDHQNMRMRRIKYHDED